MKTKSMIKNPYFVMSSIIVFLFGTAIVNSTDKKDIIRGLIKIYESPDILITDYIELAGLPAAFANSAIMGTVFVTLLLLTKHQPNPKTMMAFWLVCGFSFFGKNMVNTTPILIGGFLFSKFRKQPFKEHIVTTFLATGLAPAVMQIYYLTPFRNIIGIIMGIILGILIGFILIPISNHTSKMNTGHNLYNSGFSAGLVAMLVMAFFRGSGINFTTNSIWSEGNNDIIVIFVYVISVAMILYGIITTSDLKQLLTKIFKDLFTKDYQGDSDHIRSYLYVNMGVLGIFSCIFLGILQVEVSGPVLGAVFTIMGFGCCGKSIKNILPIMIGGTIAGSISVYGLETPSVIIAILFSSCLAPIVRDYGIIWGIVAGVLHVTFVMSSGDFYGGLNLYNNGLAGGFVAIILVPIIETIQARKESLSET